MEKPFGISTEFIEPGTVGGAEFFARNLLEGFLDSLMRGERLEIFGPPELFPDYGDRATLIAGGFRGGNRFLRESISMARHGGRLKAMLFPNYFTPPWRRGCRTVTVIHDAQYLHFPENFSFKKRGWLKAAHLMSLRMADKVVAISDFVKQDLLEAYGNKWERKIEVIHNPVSWERFERSAQPGDKHPSGRFVLSVAAQYPHKNLATLIHAFKTVRKRFPEVRLVLAGQLPERLIGTARGADLRSLVKDLGMDGAVEITGHIPDSMLASLYNAAELFVFPSLFEGFGLPPVEALGYGLPVITTRCGSIPEVTQGMAMYVSNPKDPGELAAAMMGVLNDPSSFRKNPGQIERIRNAYNPTAIAKRYLDQLRA